MMSEFREYKVKIDGEIKVYRDSAFIYNIFNKSVSKTTASSYFTPSKVKKWNFPKWLKEIIVSIQIGNIIYTPNGSYKA
jgi:hypothetical protein